MTHRERIIQASVTRSTSIAVSAKCISQVAAKIEATARVTRVSVPQVCSNKRQEVKAVGNEEVFSYAM